MMLLQKNATVTICHSRTTNLAALTRQADVLVAATGCARMVTAEMVKPGAIVIDVGINALPDGGIVGDVDFAFVREVAGAITPVPGGGGPLTNVMLLKHCVQAAWQLAGEKTACQISAYAGNDADHWHRMVATHTIVSASWEIAKPRFK